MLRTTLLAILIATAPLTALADVTAAVNYVRIHGCHGIPGTSYKLRENSRLDEAARRMSRGESLQDAPRSAGYRSLSAASLRLLNVPSDRDVAQIVERQFCSQVTDRNARDIGAYRAGPNVYLLVAAPFSPPTPDQKNAISRRVLELTNEARSHARHCGSEYFPAVPPLVMAPILEPAALEHSRDMAAHDVLDHVGHDGSTPADRVNRTGYKWRAIGENLASGVMTAEDAVNGWIGSPHHCENLMSPRFSQMAVAYAVNASSAGGIFWTQEFGTPP